MTTTRLPNIFAASLTRNLFSAARYHLGGQRGLLAIAAVALVAGIALNWSWLVAAGIAPLLLSALPCVAMCALGLCMNKMTGRSCSTDAGAQRTSDIAADDSTPNAFTSVVGVLSSNAADALRSSPPAATNTNQKAMQDQKPIEEKERQSCVNP